MAIGDHPNDLDMVQYAGIGVAMGNAVDELKKIADYITSTNNEDGAAKAIEKFILAENFSNILLIVRRSLNRLEHADFLLPLVK